MIAARDLGPLRKREGCGEDGSAQRAQAVSEGRASHGRYGALTGGASLAEGEKRGAVLRGVG